ncbi:LOW QUALITY PROTEIN: uncharacterized protein EMH_0072420 [Eimeria mitis]|uniref:Transmembrane protein n=1 Tax=Eimeria mitis TaxID=44415 RepID=U6KE83_9EIME|nr:LOW QUALITY PROTEIN: uncharacterized protein EMH_0072420 [Eimeria mitis]CDJ36259.1 hypothetical protein EMH_0072420 [Eimeria mitis]
MPERHNIVQENATPTGASAFVSSELPTVESIFTRSRNLRGKASRSSSSLRVILSALASVAAIVILVFSCSHAYNRRAVQDYRTRRLANSEDSDAAVDLCGEFGGQEEQPQRERPRLPSLPSGDGRGMPHKKRLLERVAAGATGGSAHERQQEGKQHSLSGAEARPVAVPMNASKKENSTVSVEPLKLNPAYKRLKLSQNRKSLVPRRFSLAAHCLQRKRGPKESSMPPQDC